MPTGIISKTLEFCQDQDKEFVISFDRMRVSQGPKGKTDGDVDLRGAEVTPNVHSCAK